MDRSKFKETLQEAGILDADTLLDYICNSHDGIFIVDKHGKLILANPAVINMIGADCRDLVGHTIADILESGIYEGSPSTEAAKTGKIYTGLVKTRSGVEIMSTSNPVFDKDGNLQYVISNCRPFSVIKSFFDKYIKKDIGLSGVNYQTDDHSSKYVYASKSMKEIIERSSYAAKTSCAIMLLGNTGTGKGVMAKFIHENSTRVEEKFLELNCAALPENLLESELFGYEKGAFTGASNIGKQGLFEIANNGTIFLDEIGELPLQLQAKLLKVLDTGYLLRVGGTVYHKVNVRIISATNRNLHKMMREGLFREDLFYRLNVISIRIPALKERKNEIRDIINHLLEKTNEQYSTNKKIDENAYQILSEYSWPGNIRQLENFIQRAVVLSMDENNLEKEFISSLLSEEMIVDSDHESNDEIVDGSLKEYITRMEIDYIKRCISESGGSITEAADKLGIHRTAVYKKLKSLDIKTEM